ncbi:MAG: hypothetical protein A3G34_16015 [Candidatus Lindowbacteria bacterium RIFCSPLOWO2_12_FULL_62_27]|nr:MAG: hypothetical protein A3I06_12450 [Candidatus Lindowbacteria bacterium RIFCSPLOWO2_02_FULL_62_12]OGH61130.1 MAG: hypothetical protein A3G34_16015 [Candidatus Lindowbacteria bacterium RIFCSPLOWO2_12_FULL_62_27]
MMKTKMFGLAAVGVAAVIAGLAATAVVAQAGDAYNFKITVPVELSKVVAGVVASVQCDVTAGDYLTGNSKTEVTLKDGAYKGDVVISGQWKSSSTVWPSVTESEKAKIVPGYSCKLILNGGSNSYAAGDDIAKATSTMVKPDPKATLVAVVKGNLSK